MSAVSSTIDATTAAPATTVAEPDTFTIDFASDNEEDEEEEDEEEEEEGRPAKRQRKDSEKREVVVPREPTVKKLDSITTALMRATGNDDDGGFCMFNTSSSYPMIKIFKKEMALARKLIKETKFSQALCVLVAIFMNMERYDCWFSDSDDPKNVEGTFTAYYKLIQDVLKQSDETLQLVGRDILVSEMKKLGDAAKESFDYNFKWF